jgi:hypothetical protein
VRGLRIALPWVVGTAILCVLFWRIDPELTLAALGSGAVASYLPIACVFICLWLALDAYTLSWLFSRLVGPVGWVEMMRLRAATYPVMALSFHLASAALVPPVARATRSPLSRVAGGMVVHTLGDLCALATLAAGVSLLLHSPLLTALRPLLAVIALGTGALLLAGPRARRLLGGRPVVEVLAALAPARVVTLIGLRVVFYLSFALFVRASGPSFGVEIPLVDLGARMPLVLAIAALPISAGGIGTTQAAMLWLFAPFAGEPQILAYALVYGVTLLVLRLPLGVVAWWYGRARSLPAGEVLA